MAKHPSDIFPCVITSADYGEKLDKSNRPTGILTVRINAAIADGPHAGLQSYEEEITNKSAPYAVRCCKAVGWKGDDLKTLAADCAAWVKATGGVSTIEISHIPVERGPNAGSIWHKPNSIGRGAKPLAKPSASALNDANQYMRAALAEDAPQSDSDDSPF